MKKVYLAFVMLVYFSPAIGQEHSVARKWCDVLLDAIRNDFARPTVHARNLYHTSLAMYDSWAAYDSIASPYLLGNTVGGFSVPFTGVSIPEDDIAAREEAMSYAAYRVIKHRFFYSPGSDYINFKADSLLQALGYDITYSSTDYENQGPAALGNYIGDKVIEFGLVDGSNEGGSYANQYYLPVNPDLVMIEPGNPDIIDPNRWQPLALETFVDQNGIPFTTVPPFLSPEWGNVIPFALSDDDMTTYFRDGDAYQVYHDPGSPPQIDTLGSREYDAAYRWGFEMVDVWSSHLDPSDGVMWDISPASIGNSPPLPVNYDDYDEFYDFYNGGDAGTGRPINPYTGLPYEPQIVPRGDYARVLAEFWADGPDSETPPGHWFTILNYVNDHPAMEHRWMGEGEVLSSLEWDVKSYFILGGTVHDAAITAWSIKGWYDFIRPVSALRFMADHGQSTDPDLPSYHPAGVTLREGLIELIEAGDPLAGENGEHIGKIKFYTWRGHYFIEDPETDVAGVGWIRAEDWWPYQRPSFVTPPFAGFVSGHSTYSRAAAEALTFLTGDEYFPGGMSEFHAPANEFLVFEDGPSVEVVLQWATYRDASDQCSLSRIWGGIHPPCDDIPGRLAGIEVGLDAFNYARTYIEAGLPHLTNAAASANVINASMAGQSIDLEITFDTEMDQEIIPSFSFITANVDGVLLQNGVFEWMNSTTGVMTWEIIGMPVEVDDIQVKILGAISTEGRQQAIWIGDSGFRYDAIAPSAVEATCSLSFLNETIVDGGGISVLVPFSEPMNTQIAPTIAVSSGQGATTLTQNIASSIWINNSLYRIAFSLQDSDVQGETVAFDISGFVDLAGNTGTLTNLPVDIYIDTQQPQGDLVLADTYTIDFDNWNEERVVVVWFDEPMNIESEPVFSFPGNGWVINAGPAASGSGWINENAYSYQFSPAFTTGPDIFVDLEVSGARDQWNNVQDPYLVENFWEILLDPTHVGETDRSNLITYPNPVSKESNLFISGAPDGTLRVFDVSGRTVAEFQHDSRQATVLSTSGWSAGIYTLSIRVEGGEIRRVVAVY